MDFFFDEESLDLFSEKELAELYTIVGKLPHLLFSVLFFWKNVL